MRSLKEQREFFKKSQKRTGKYKTDKKGRAIIDVGAENYGDIFSSYSLDGANVFDKECSEFVENRADLIPTNKDLIIKFHVKDATEKMRKEIEYAFRENYLRELDKTLKKIKLRSLFSLVMLLCGVGLFFLYYFSVKLSLHLSIKLFLEIATWVFTWEAVHSFFLERQQLKMERIKKYRLIYSKIEIVEFENNNVSNEDIKTLKLQKTKQKIENLKSRYKNYNKN